MNIWLVRHGQTDWNKDWLMQGRTDVPLNEEGIGQAHIVSDLIGNVDFDAVYSSPLSRALKTASIAAGVDEKQILVDERLIEVDFGKYEKIPYKKIGTKMTLYWTLPEIFPAPKGVESVKSLVERASSFLKDIECREYNNVLVVAHGGIMRALNGYLCDHRNGIKWRPRMKNCEVRVYESLSGKHRLLKTLAPEGEI